MSKSKIKADKEKEKELEPTIEELKKELEAEQKSKDTVEWSNVELERREANQSHKHFLGDFLGDFPTLFNAVSITLEAVHKCSLSILL